MRADRLLSILMMLQVQGRLTARDLAEQLEVSERTIHRDMEALSSVQRKWQWLWQDYLLSVRALES
jgi:predicted DNA-binding transcriptional regulator YafY